MDEINPKELFGQAPILGLRPGTDCPDEQILTAALDGDLEGIERTTFEAHVSGCDYCLAQLGRIARLKRDVASEEISDFTMARAQRLIRSRRVLPRAPAWAAAAMVGFAAILTTLWFIQAPQTPEPGTIPVPEVRNIDPDVYRPQVLFPSDGAAVDLRHRAFEWTPVPGTLHYDVRIVSADGAVIWQERVENPEWRLPGHLRLAAGEDYYFRVDAYLTQAKSLSSRHVMFRVETDD
jgi:hypothetical protein